MLLSFLSRSWLHLRNDEGKDKTMEKERRMQIRGEKKKQVSSIAFPTLFPSFVLILLIEWMFQVKKYNLMQLSKQSLIDSNEFVRPQTKPNRNTLFSIFTYLGRKVVVPCSCRPGIEI